MKAAAKKEAEKKKKADKKAKEEEEEAAAAAVGKLSPITSSYHLLLSLIVTHDRYSLSSFLLPFHHFDIVLAINSSRIFLFHFLFLIYCLSHSPFTASILCFISTQQRQQQQP